LAATVRYAETRTSGTNVLVKNKVDSWWLGPGSMKINRKGNVYVAQWSSGKRRDCGSGQEPGATREACRAIHEFLVVPKTA